MSNDDLRLLPTMSPCQIYRIPLPQTSSISFESLFKDVDARTREFFCELTKSRAAFTRCCQADALSGAVDAIDAYVPAISALALDAKTKIELFARVPLKVQWSTPLSTRHQFTMLASTNASDRFMIEHVFVLLSAGLCLRHLAREQLLAAGDSRNVDLFVQQSILACKTLHSAAGIFEHIQTVLLPSWPAALRGIPELNESFYEMMCKLSLAESQSIAARRAVARGLPLARRLLAGAAELWSQTVALLEPLSKQEGRIRLVLVYARLCAAQHGARVQWIGAFEAHARMAFGESCALYRAAVATLATAEAKEARARHEGGAIEQAFFDGSSAELARLESAFQFANAENNSAFFEPEPRLSALPVVEPAIIVKPEPFQPAACAAIVDVQFEQKTCTVQ